MPILAPQPTTFPEALFETSTAEFSERRWSVLQTRSRQEKRTASSLHESGVPYFLPLIPKRLLIRGKTMQSYLPLFSGYVFLLGDHQDEQFARATRRVARVIDVPDQVRLWQDLQQINQLIASGVPIRPEDQLVPGAPVEIRNGPLAGLRGVIVKSSTGNRFIVKVDFIQRGASVMLDECALSRVFE